VLNVNADDRTFENCLAELLKRAYAEDDMEVAEHLLRALEIVVRRNDTADEVIDRLRQQPGRE
jgi:hypothetical protein